MTTVSISGREIESFNASTCCKTYLILIEFLLTCVSLANIRINYVSFFLEGIRYDDERDRQIQTFELIKAELSR